MARNRDYWVRRAREHARAKGLDPNIFVRQVGAESNFRTGARSPVGAVGLGQIMPKYHLAPARKMGLNIYNPEDNLAYAAHYMSTLVKRHGNYRDALSAYNSGRPWRVGQGIAETRGYVGKILGGKNPAGGATPVSNANPSEPVSVGKNTAYGGAPTRPQALAAFMLDQSQRLVRGEGIDFGGMAMAAKTDRDEAAKSIEGMDRGGEDPDDPRVKIEMPSGKGPGGAAGMRRAIAMARKMGLRVSGNHAATGRPETSGHTRNSDHYKYLAPGIQGAIDVSGNPRTEMAYFRWLERNRQALGLKDLFHDPAGYSYDEGRRWGKTIGGHQHVHFSAFGGRR